MPAECNVAEPRLSSPKGFLKEAKWIASVCRKIGKMDFSDALVYHMRERKSTIEKLKEKSFFRAGPFQSCGMRQKMTWHM